VDWYWALANPNGGVDGSSMSKLMKNRDSLSDTALLAREAIQNSSDAAERFKKKHGGVPFRVIFRFVEVSGSDKNELVEVLDLEGLAKKRDAYPTKKPVQSGSILDGLDDPKKPLRLLFVEDYGTHGLYGHPQRKQKNSHLYLAMYYIGGSDKPADAGGSYGFGKSALERASRVHTVIAHTAFEREEDDPVTSRLVGFTWWPSFQLGNSMYEGRASFANHRANDPSEVGLMTPFEDDDAATLATAIGFQQRIASNKEDLGTSFLIVDPFIEPENLLREIEKWWWPALEDNKVHIEVVMPDGEVRTPKPLDNPFVAQFIHAYRIAVGIEEVSDPNKERLASREWRDKSGFGGSDLGALGLVVPDNPVDEDGDEGENAPLVALMRDPRMVIQYLKYKSRRISLRGAFVASSRSNDLLRDTEPSSHDCWTKNPSADVADEATSTAKTILDKIRDSVTRMAKEISPPPPKSNKALGTFSKLMQGFLGNKRGTHKPPPPGGEPIELLQERPTLTASGRDDVKVTSKFSVRVANNAKGETCVVNVKCQVFITEDDNPNGSQWPVKLKPTEKDHAFFQEEDGSWSGEITKEEKVSFWAISDPYSSLWTSTVQPLVTANKWSA
jgi:hypothetical protein